MRTLWIAGLLLFIASFAGWAGEAEPTPEQLAGWVKQLGDESFDKRIAAEAALRKAGDPARGELEKATQSEDTETKARATRLLGVLRTEPVLRKVEAAVIGAKSMEADMAMSMKMNGMQIEMKAHVKSMADGKRFTMDGTTQTTGISIPMHIVSDGTTMWSEMEMPGGQGKMVHKFSMVTMEKLSGGQSQNPVAAFKQLRQQFDFTDVKDGQIDGEDVHVLEGKLRDGIIERQLKAAEEVAGPMAAQMAKQQFDQMKIARVHISKQDLLLRKSEVLDVNGEPVVSMALSKLKTGVNLDESLFKYTPPEGASILDMEEQFKAAREMGAPGAGGAGGRGGF